MVAMIAAMCGVLFFMYSATWLPGSMPLALSTCPIWLARSSICRYVWSSPSMVRSRLSGILSTIASNTKAWFMSGFVPARGSDV